MASESRKTVLVALAANSAIAVAKLAAGAIGGSSAMLAEGAHSIADTTNQLFLLGSLRFSKREPDEQHPFGYGKERFCGRSWRRSSSSSAARCSRSTRA